MKYIITKVEYIAAQPGVNATNRLVVQLDPELRELLAHVDLDIHLQLGRLSYDFAAATSEVAMLSAIANDIKQRKLRANLASRFSHLVGKEYEA
jgi:hypothetical protein